MQTNRKRNRSDDVDFHCQSKYFVNQRMVNSLDQKYMKTVFGKRIHKLWRLCKQKRTGVTICLIIALCIDKTMGLLFQGAKNVSNNNQLLESKEDKFRSIRLDGEGNIIFMNGGAESNDKMGCISCNKMSTVQSECSNCNLNLCEHCGISCANCLEAHICKHCVQILWVFFSNINLIETKLKVEILRFRFSENNVNSLPCCRTCKMFA